MKTILIVLALLASGIVVFQIFDWMRRRRILKERRDETICTFARSLQYREIDLQIVRNTIEVLGVWWSAGKDQIPFRKTDRIADFGCVDDDLDDCGIEVCKRSGRSLEFEENPMAGKVETVEDFITLVNLQPKVSANRERKAPYAPSTPR